MSNLARLSGGGVKEVVNGSGVAVGILSVDWWSTEFEESSSKLAETSVTGTNSPRRIRSRTGDVRFDWWAGDVRCEIALATVCKAAIYRRRFLSRCREERERRRDGQRLF